MFLMSALTSTRIKVKGLNLYIFLAFQKCRLFFSGGDIEQSSAGCSSSDAEFELALVVTKFAQILIKFSAGDFDFDDDG